MTSATTATTLARGLVAGLAATAAMTTTTALERRLRTGVHEPVDYDASDHVVTAVATVLRRRPRDRHEEQGYFALAHWGYGSAVALAYAPLRRRLGPGRAPIVFGAGCQVMAMTLFPLLGGTPTPWHWRRDVVLSSLTQHVVYTLTVASLDRVLAGA